MPPAPRVPFAELSLPRRYFRVRVADGAPVVLAVHQSAIDFATMPFVAVARLLADRLINTGILAFWVFALMIPLSLVLGMLDSAWILASETCALDIIGARFVRLGAPIGLFAFTVCPGAIEQQLPDEIVKTRALLPASVATLSENQGLLRMGLRLADSAKNASADCGCTEP